LTAWKPPRPRELADAHAEEGIRLDAGDRVQVDPALQELPGLHGSRRFADLVLQLGAALRIPVADLVHEK
jgi:hypothetical protein